MTTILEFLFALTTLLSCSTGTLTLHNNFESVFYNFPDRLTNDTHGYVATFNCNDIGKKGFLVVGNKVITVSVADCLATSDYEKDPLRYKGWVADVGEYSYWALRTKEHGNYGTLCLIK